MSKYYTMSNCPASCKGKKKHGTKRKRRRDDYIKSSRPFAPEYSTSTISKAINLVYGRPELPSMSKYQDLPETTHFNIFHNRTGVSNANSELGHNISLQHDVNPHNHYIDSPGSQVSGATNVNSIYRAETTRAGDTVVDILGETSPVHVLDTSVNASSVQSTPLSTLPARQQLFPDENNIDGSGDNVILEGNAGNMDEEFRSQTNTPSPSGSGINAIRSILSNRQSTGASQLSPRVAQAMGQMPEMPRYNQSLNPVPGEGGTETQITDALNNEINSARGVPLEVAGLSGNRTSGRISIPPDRLDMAKLAAAPQSGTRHVTIGRGRGNSSGGGRG